MLPCIKRNSKLHVIRCEVPQQIEDQTEMSTCLTCQVMQLPAVLGITGVKLAGHADSDKATGRPEAVANFPKKKKRGTQETRGTVSAEYQLPSSSFF